MGRVWRDQGTKESGVEEELGWMCSKKPTLDGQGWRRRGSLLGKGVQQPQLHKEANCIVSVFDVYVLTEKKMKMNDANCKEFAV
ncbi:hypothetical protein C1H46_034620 [Malus baccata]|uniref:Uncharacterized protein n=1 Tax=Malus baccata TaxID=106549 RepID=A0A540L003_MALBA|nr:hypothetical protein C1H46_034620 [Malus baccata]